MNKINNNSHEEDEKYYDDDGEDIFHGAVPFEEEIYVGKIDELPENLFRETKELMNKIKDQKEIEDALGEINKYQQWQVTSKGVYQAIGKMVTCKTIPSGYYSLKQDQKGNIFVMSKDFIYDDYIDLPIPEFKEIIEDIDKFWKIENKFEEYGFVFKRGILIHGKQGLGKSFLINGIIKDLIEKRGGVVFSLFNEYDLSVFHQFFREQFRLIEPKRPVIVVIEDIDGLCRTSSTETQLINILDGVEHSSNMIYLATTNHIERLEERITNRPSRFDRRYHIKAPDENVRKVFIENKMKKEDLKKIDIDEWVEKTDGFNLAHIKELIISVIIYENKFEYALEHLNKMRERPETEGEYSSGSKKFGFGA